MKITKVFALLAAIVAFSSCATSHLVSQEANMNAAWVGKTHADVIQTYGAPDREVTDGNNGMVLIYEKLTTRSHTSTTNYGGPWYGPWGGPWGPDYNTTVYTDKDYVHFYVNPTGNVYQVKTNLMASDGTKTIDAGTTVFGVFLGSCLLIPLIAAIFGGRGGGAVVVDPYYYY